MGKIFVYWEDRKNISIDRNESTQYLILTKIEAKKVIKRLTSMLTKKKNSYKMENAKED